MIKVSFYDAEKHFCCIDEDCVPKENLESFVEKGIYKIENGKVIFSYSVLPTLRNLFAGLLVDFDVREIRQYYDKSLVNFDTTDKLFLRDDQYNTIKTISGKYRGLVQCRTGQGKTEMMIYLAKTCKLSGNKLILTNNNQVAEEICLRFGKYDIDPDSLNLKILNPISFMNSNRCKDAETRKFFADVTFIQIDELESVTSSLRELLQMTPKYKILYGYSASPEKVKGLDLSNPSCILQVNEDAVQVLSLAGFSAVYSAPEKPLYVNIIESHLPNEWFPAWTYGAEDNPGALVIKQKMSQSNLFKTGVIFRALDEIILPNTQDILFIPYRFIEHGDKLFDHYKKSKYRIIQWDGEKIRSNIKGKDELKQKDIKQLSIDKEFDILIASAVANRGVDFRNMKDSLLYIHSQYSNVIQSLGRLSRESAEEAATVWLIHNKDKNTPFYTMMSMARLNRIKSAYANAEVKIKKWEL